MLAESSCAPDWRKLTTCSLLLTARRKDALHRDDKGHHQKWLHIVVRQTAARNRERLKVHLHEWRSGGCVRVARTSLGHGDGGTRSPRVARINRVSHQVMGVNRHFTREQCNEVGS